MNAINLYAQGLVEEAEPIIALRNLEKKNKIYPSLHCVPNDPASLDQSSQIC